MNLFLWLEVLCAASLAVMLVLAFVTIGGRTDDTHLISTATATLLLVGALFPALGLIVLWGRRIAIRRAGGTTARLHVNLVFFFSTIAAVPTLLVAVFASILFQAGAEFWFSDRQRGILENANELARGYYDENQRAVGAEALAMAGDLRFLMDIISITGDEFQQQYGRQVWQRELSESAILVEGQDGGIRTFLIVDPSSETETQRVEKESIDRLRAGESVVVNAEQSRIEAVVTLDDAQGMYLYVMRDSNPLGFGQWERAQRVLREYDQLSERSQQLLLQFNLALFVTSIALVSLAVWAALRFADRQVKPLADLAEAAREIGAGNYAMRVDGRTGPDEIGLLNRAFNRMSAQIERQTDALLGANTQLANRRAFIEAVLQSITAGIVSVDGEARVLLMNASAQELLLEKQGPAPVGEKLEDVAPQFVQLLESGMVSGIVQLNRSGELLTLAVKLAPSSDGYVITFEDITRQLLDQRQAAWSDVARRIAHEIKNPLTPIQLATERLQRRYTRQIAQDTELFEELTGTIIRQVGDLRKMVDEFSSFARLPKPVFRSEDAVDLLRQSLFLQEVARPDITYSLRVDGEIPHIDCDRHQFGQAMTNVLKNAAEAVEARGREAPLDWRAKINVLISVQGQHLAVKIDDNGIGLPTNGENIIEPYVTTREKGTGLGLAIVKKIVEEHGGEIFFKPHEQGGTSATMRFALHPSNTESASEAAE